jgi:hypothetical protein
LGIGDWGLGPIPNPQSPIPNPQSPIPTSILLFNLLIKKLLFILFYIFRKFQILNYISIAILLIKIK